MIYLLCSALPGALSRHHNKHLAQSPTDSADIAPQKIIEMLNADFPENRASNALILGELRKHNEFRSLHKSPPLVLDYKLCKAAIAYAKYLYENDLFEHSSSANRGGAGENLAYNSEDGYSATEMWYSEVSDYKYANVPIPDNFYEVGHFTQVVWKSTRRLGIGYYHQFSVGRYFPAGNVYNKFTTNVLPK